MEKMGGKRLGGGGGGGGGGSGGGGGGGCGGGGRDRTSSVGGSSTQEEEGGVKPEKNRPVPAITYTRPPPLNRHAKNYAILDLNGSAIEVRYRWRRVVLKYRLWCFNTSNLRYEFGDPNRRCCTLPVEGHFLIYVHCDERWLCAVIDGPSGYLDGFITRSDGTDSKDHRICENNETKKGTQYVEHAKKMPWDGGYYKAMSRKCGHLSLLESFHVIYAHVEAKGPRHTNLQVIGAGETFVLHFSEAGRSDDLFQDNISTNFSAGNAVGIKPVDAAREWKSTCTTIYRALGINDAEFSDKPKHMRRTSARGRVTTYSEAEKAKIALKDIRLLHRPNHKHGYFYLRDMPMHLSKEGSVDSTWAQRELRESHELDLANPNWGFLMERFPAFPSPSDEGSTETLLKNGYIRTKEAMINKGMRTDLPPILDLALSKPGEFDKHLVAYHESGHAIVALHTPCANPIHKVTILPQGSFLGMVTQVSSWGDASTMEQLLARLDVCLGGRVAEELIFGEQNVTSGAENDLVTARQLAQNMVSNCCMSDRADMVHVEKSPRAGETQEVDTLLKESYRRVKLLLKEHEKELEAVANGLLEAETLSQDMVLNIVQQHQPRQDT
ncbi:unnamed protein product [Urochloa decumbens]|uniref:Peptidase M41 domain-containing protein n=1 Tax=Urochloa decumbens TaxID=240449 RepID=A0ABC9GUK1_9POAL